MRIAILSDFHFGFGAGGERKDDPYDAFAEAIEKALHCDLIIFGGDLFDSRNPDSETFARSMELMSRPLLMQSDVKLIQGIGKDVSKISEMALMGIPMVAIHGTHERRTRGLMNPVEALERAGFLLYLHCNGVVFEKNGERVAIQGMSGVPDQYAESVLSEWDPKPEHGCFNIFLLHQSISEFLYAKHTLDLAKLPKGFDLYVDGHIHEAKADEYAGKPFLLAGSLIPTQLKEESEKPKGFWIIETSVKDRVKPEGMRFSEVTDRDGLRIYWIELENQRRFYYRAFDGQGIEEMEKELNEIAEANREKKPLVRVSLKKANDALIKELEMKFGEKFLLSFRKEKEIKKIPTKTLEEHKLSVEDMGRKILRQNLKKAKLDSNTFEGIFELLVEGKSKEVEGMLTEPPPAGEKEQQKKPEPVKGAKQTVLFRK